MELSFRDTSFSVTSQGRNAPALVLLHYFGGASTTWQPLINHLSDTVRCIAPDLRGFGATPATPSGYTLDEQADDIAALLAELDIKSFVLVGHSMGGKIALALAARQPTGLQGLVLVAPSPPTPEPMEDAERTKLLHGYGDRVAMEQTVQQITAQPLPPALFEQEVVNHMRASDPAWRAWLEHGSREDISAAVGAITVPTLVLSGDADSVIPTAVLREEVLARITGARLVVLPGVGHLSPLEATDALAEHMREILGNLT